MMIPAEIGLFRNSHVEPKRKAYAAQLSKGGPGATLAARAAYAAALTQYVKFLLAHRYAVPVPGEPPVARPLRAAINLECRWAADELEMLADGGQAGTPGESG